ncbi:MAG TPA: alpha/beta hydrolase [Ktedonobacterales bacterium]|jgi:pimeloyl-ACP methyl ester carboxylesterase|nr:alpha/beta hydrolase [Ktedonobacterales bacterium]
MDTALVGDLEIAYERTGKGPALLLLHGGASDHREWRRQIDALSDEFTVVAWDAPGCGQSSDPPEIFRLPDYADCLAGFIAALGLERPHVLGLSFGGGLALELYRRHPTLPRSLILASAYAGWAGFLPAEVVEQRLRQVLSEAALPADQWVSGWLPGLLSANAPAGATEELIAIISSAHPAGMRVMARSFAEADLRDVLEYIAVPTLVLYGSADQRVPLSVAEGLHASIPGSRLVVMPGVGHQSNMDAPDLFNLEVRSFLRPLNP